MRVEVKKSEDWNMDAMFHAPKWGPWTWFEQAKGQARDGYFPLLVFTRNHQPFYAMLEQRVALWLKLKPSSGSVASVSHSRDPVTVCLLDDLIQTDLRLLEKHCTVKRRAS
jgi:hypothetical protein